MTIATMERGETFMRTGPGWRRLWWLRALLVLAVGLPAVDASAPTTAEAETQSAPAQPAPAVIMHHYNICGAVANDPDNPACNPQQGQTAKEVLVWQKAADGAWFVSVNEMCMADGQELAEGLQADGTAVISLPESEFCDVNPDPGEPRDQRFGNAVFHPGGVWEDDMTMVLPNPGLDCSEDDVECRAMVCVKTGTFAGPWNQCTAHLTSTSTDVAQTQARAYLDEAAAYTESGRGLSLAGDFNINPTQIPTSGCNVIPSCYEPFSDLVIGDTFEIRPDGPPDSQIDFIWVEDTTQAVYYTALCSGTFANASDHCWTRGDAIP